MDYKYTEKDLDLISWQRIDGFIDKIYIDSLIIFIKMFMRGVLYDISR